MDAPSSTRRLPFLRRRATVAVAVLCALLLAALAGLNGFFYRQTRERFQEELEQRLLHLGENTRILVEHELSRSGSPDPSTPPTVNGPSDPSALQPLLARIVEANRLQNVFVFNRRRQSLADARPEWSPGREYSLLQLDPRQIDLAWNGQSTVSRPYNVEDLYFRACYVPVHLGNLSTPNAVCCVEASIDYLGALRSLEQTLYLSTLLSVAIVGVFGILLAFTFSSLNAAAEAIGQSERLALMGELAAKVAHEIRNPLGIIKGTAEVLREKLAKAGQGEAMFDFILEEVRRIDGIAENFLQLSREVPLRRQPMSITDLLDRACASLETSLDASRIRLVRRFPADLPPVLGDRAKLQQVLLNLLLNSVEAIPDRGEIVVEAAADPAPPAPPTAILVTIADTGPGIPQALQRDVFKPFVTTKPDGTGLGLPIARQLVEQHGGTLTLSSAPGRGTTITLRLPPAIPSVPAPARIPA